MLGVFRVGFHGRRGGEKSISVRHGSWFCSLAFLSLCGVHFCLLVCTINAERLGIIFAKIAKVTVGYLVFA